MLVFDSLLDVLVLFLDCVISLILVRPQEPNIVSNLIIVSFLLGRGLSLLLSLLLVELEELLLSL